MSPESGALPLIMFFSNNLAQGDVKLSKQGGHKVDTEEVEANSTFKLRPTSQLVYRMPHS